MEHLALTLGLSVQYPCFTRRRKFGGSSKMVTEPLFPQYLFSQFDITTAFRAVRYTHDVLDIVGLGGVATVVPEALIGELQQIAEHATRVHSDDSEFHAGEHVEVTGGPLSGLEAVILNAPTDRDRVGILLSILGCGARFTVSRYDLAKSR